MKHVTCIQLPVGESLSHACSFTLSRETLVVLTGRATTMDALSLSSTVRLSDGNSMPILGLGVFENDNCSPACLTALKHGYRHIDSARYYHNEAEVGQAVRESGVPREEIFVTSKIYHPEHGYDSTLLTVQDSLNQFGFEYIDLYLIHSPLSGKSLRLDTYRALLQAKKEGKLKSVGVSNYGPKHLEEIKEAGLEMPSVNQVELHPFCQQRAIATYCRENNIVVQAYSPLVRGNMEDKDGIVSAVAEKYGKTPAQIFIRWSLQHAFIPLPKSANPERIVSNAQVFDFVIAEEDMQRLDGLDRGGKGAVTWNPVDAE